ncbi:MAG: hypothetical protein HYY43_01420 [Deltaproteobacteria bacterium]|nr:hypothetical protein [Deltaproteobacteria bacterium]
MTIYSTIDSARAAANSFGSVSFFDWSGSVILDAAEQAASSMKDARHDLDVLCLQNARKGNLISSTLSTVKLAFWYGALTGAIEFGAETAVNLPLASIEMMDGNISLSDVGKGIDISLRRKWNILTSLPDRLAKGEIASLSRDMTMEGAEIYFYAKGAAGAARAAANGAKTTVAGLKKLVTDAADEFNAGRLVPVVGVLDAGGGTKAAAAAMAASPGNSTVPAIMAAVGSTGRNSATGQLTAISATDFVNEVSRRLGISEQDLTYMLSRTFKEVFSIRLGPRYQQLSALNNFKFRVYGHSRGAICFDITDGTFTTETFAISNRPSLTLIRTTIEEFYEDAFITELDLPTHYMVLDGQSGRVGNGMGGSRTLPKRP